MQQETDIDQLIVRSFSNTLSTEDQLRLTEWLNEDADNKQYYMQMKSIWNAGRPAFNPDAIDTEKAERLLLSKMNKRSWMQLPAIVWWQRIAAVLLLPLLLAAGYYMVSRHNTFQQLAWQEINAPYGITSKINLPDGTAVWLNSGSRLKFPSVFNGDERHVVLSGEGFFMVHSDKQHPFIVETPKMNIRATGTRFNVEAYSSDTLVAVTLVEGKVDVNIGNSMHTGLHPDQRIVYNSHSHKYNLTNTDAQQWALWKDGKLVFRDEPLEEVFKRLGRAFNVDISVKDKSIAKQPYRATFEGESFDEILRLLKLTAPLRYVRSGKFKQTNNAFNKERIEVYKED
jgi:Fe2+-dicitrate sensor, membrane component